MSTRLFLIYDLLNEKLHHVKELSKLCLEYAEPRLWELIKPEVKQETDHTVWNSFNEYLKGIHKDVDLTSWIPADPWAWYWQENYNCTSYEGDILVLYFNCAMASWVKICKDDEPVIREYLDKCNLLQRL